jgi:transaldolase
MDRVTGPHLTFVDPRHHGDSSAMVKNARRLISLFQESGVGRDQIVVSVSTWFLYLRDHGVEYFL